VSGSDYAANLFHRIEVRAQTTVHGEDLLVDDGGNWQAVEAVGKSLPQLDVVPALALVIEAVNAVDRRAFMIATENEEVLRILDLVGKQQADCLKRLLPSVNIVAKKQIVGFWWEAAILEETQKVIVLAVDVAANLESLPSSAILRAEPRQEQ
jgi:hypothetical protein